MTTAFPRPVVERPEVFASYTTETDQKIREAAEAKRELLKVERVMAEAQEAFALAKVRERAASTALAAEMDRRISYELEAEVFEADVDGASPE